jgi:hypothetical protein
MRTIRLRILAFAALACFVVPARASETLEVGPGKPYQKVSAAIAKAKDGDVIEVAAGTYEKDVAYVRTSNLTIRGVEPDAAGKLPSQPILEYVLPHDVRVRPVVGKLDVGSFEFTPEEAR